MYSELSQSFTLTGGSVVGLIYDKGVIVSTDMLASFGRLSRYKDFSRIFPCGPHTVIIGGGEISDLLYLTDKLNQTYIEDWCNEDDHSMEPSEYASLASRILYNKRSKIDPLLTAILVAGYKDNKPFLGYTDQYGTIFQEKFAATGLGRYFAGSLIREHYHPDITLEEAKELILKAWRVHLARDLQFSNMIQFATITEGGISIQEPFKISTYWNAYYNP